MNVTELLEVIDDCLNTILRYLPLTDLSSFSEICLRLRAIAIRVFSVNFSVLNISLYDYDGFYRFIRRILINFGGLINDLIAYYLYLKHKIRPQSTEFYCLIARYRGSNL